LDRRPFPLPSVWSVCGIAPTREGRDDSQLGMLTVDWGSIELSLGRAKVLWRLERGSRKPPDVNNRRMGVNL
jgi:hypothetical protein